MEKAGVVFDKEDAPPKGEIVDELSKEQDYTNLSIEELERAIKKAVKNEDYEMAARLRDEISKRENNASE